MYQVRLKEEYPTRWSDVKLVFAKKADGSVTLAGSGVSEFCGTEFDFTLSGYVDTDDRIAVVTKTHSLLDAPVLTYRLVLGKNISTNAWRIVGMGKIEPGDCDVRLELYSTPLD